MWLLLANFMPIFSFPSIELTLYDWLAANKGEMLHSRAITLVGLTATDWLEYGNPVEDQVIANTLKIIERYQPAFIGLNFWRTRKHGEGHEELLQILAQYTNIVGSQWKEALSIIEPPEPLTIPGRTGDVTVLYDRDQVIRRFTLYSPSENFPDEKEFNKTAQYNYIRSLPWELARRFLLAQGVKIIEPTKSSPLLLEYPNGKMIKLQPLQDWLGKMSYSQWGNRGFQQLIHWPSQNFEFPLVSFHDVLSYRVPPDFFHNKIILIGGASNRVADIYSTPYKINGDRFRATRYGLELMAIATLNLLSLEVQKPTLIPSGLINYLWIAFWVCLSGGGVYFITRFPTRWWLGSVCLINGLLILVLGSVCYAAFPNGFIPSGLAALGMIINSLACLLEIQRHKAIEEQKKRLAEERKRQLAQQEYTRQLEKRVQEIQERMLSQERLAFFGQLSPAIRHEILNNFEVILQEITITLEMAESKIYQGFPDEVLEFLEDLRETLTIIAETTRESGEILTKYLPPIFLQSFNDDVPLDELSYTAKKAINLASFLEDCWKKSSYKFRVNTPTNFYLSVIKQYDYQGNIYGNEEDLRYVFINLIDNAYEALIQQFLKASDNYEPILKLATLQTTQGVEVIIEDNGIGIEPEKANEIFKPFYSTKTRSSGLGLSIAKDILITRYEANIYLNLEEGTRFIIVFPL